MSTWTLLKVTWQLERPPHAFVSREDLKLAALKRGGRAARLHDGHHQHDPAGVQRLRQRADQVQVQLSDVPQAAVKALRQAPSPLLLPAACSSSILAAAVPPGWWRAAALWLLRVPRCLIRLREGLRSARGRDDGDAGHGGVAEEAAVQAWHRLQACREMSLLMAT